MSYLPHIWVLLGLLLVGAEFLIPGFVIFFFGAGALVTGALTALIPGLKSSLVLQILLWLATSAAALFSLRKYFAKAFKGKLLKKDGEDEFVGRQAVVYETIRPDRPGRVRFQGTTWTAVSYSESFEPEETVEILSKENLTLVVTKSILGNIPEQIRREK